MNGYLLEVIQNHLAVPSTYLPVFQHFIETVVPWLTVQYCAPCDVVLSHGVNNFVMYEVWNASAEAGSAMPAPIASRAAAVTAAPTERILFLISNGLSHSHSLPRQALHPGRNSNLGPDRAEESSLRQV